MADEFSAGLRADREAALVRRARARQRLVAQPPRASVPKTQRMRNSRSGARIISITWLQSIALTRLCPCSARRRSWLSLRRRRHAT